MKRIVVFLVLFPALLMAQEGGNDVWSDLRFLVGSWSGDEQGVPGVGVGSRTYEFVIQDRYLMHRNRSKFEPQEKNPKGELHEDWAMIDFDNGRGAFVMRSFHVEGFVVTAIMQPQEQPGLFVFISESIDNAPPCMRTRYTIEKKGDDAFSEIFEVAMPDKEFSPMVRSEWTRNR